MVDTRIDPRITYATDKDGNILYNKDGSPRRKAGRKKGQANMHEFRSRATAKFMREFSRHFEKNGRKAIDDLYKEDPVKYVQLMASMMPKQSEVTTEDVTEHKALTTVELANRLAGIIGTAAAEGVGGASKEQYSDMDSDTRPPDGGIPH